MKYGNRLIICLAVIFLIFGKATAQQTNQSTDPLTIGIVHSTRFPYAHMMKDSFEMALAAINESGGINGTFECVWPENLATSPFLNPLGDKASQ